MSELILVIEDETALRETLAYNLRKEGYRVETAAEGPTGLEDARRLHPDLVLLDIMLPGMDGFEICRTLRRESALPILMLTARDDEIDRVVGLEVGADDYMSKPFSMRELLARVRAMLRRVRLIRAEVEMENTRPDPPPSTPISTSITFENLVIDTERHEVRLGSQPLALKPKEYDLILYLARHRGQALTRDRILEEVWGWDYTGDSRTVDVHVRWLREKVEIDPANPRRIVTVRGAGYRFEG